jgi:hypothetical protein
MSKVSASVRLDERDFERIKLVAQIDRRSISEVIADCVARELPALEAELQQPRLSPEMVARLKAGETVADVMRKGLVAFAPTPLPPAPEPLEPKTKKKKAGGVRFEISEV